MARITAKNASIFVDGRTISGRSNSATLGFTVEAPEITSFGEGTRQRLPAGLKDIELTVDGFYDESASNVDELFNSLLAASAHVAFYPTGSAGSAKGREFVGIITDYTVPLAIADAAATSITVTTGASGTGLIYANSLGGSISSVSASTALSSVDFSGSGAAGYAVFRLFSVGGASPVITACLQDSNDDSAWTTIGLFTAASYGNTVQRISYTTGSRYRRAKYIMTGTNASATWHMSCGSEI